MSELTEILNFFKENYNTRLERIERSYEKLSGEITDTSKTIVKIEGVMNGIACSVDELKMSMAKLTEQPTNRWNTLVSNFIGGAVGAIFTALGFLLFNKK